MVASKVLNQDVSGNENFRTIDFVDERKTILPSAINIRKHPLSIIANVFTYKCPKYHICLNKSHIIW